MKNSEKWIPSKFVFKNGRLRASRDATKVGRGSRLIADLVASLYQQQLANHAKGRLLDLGCGNVPLFHAYRDFITDNTCVDWGNTLHKNSHLDFECDLTKTLPFEDKSFDTILLSDVLEHIPNPDLLWSELSRVLRDGGKVILNVPFYYWLHEAPHDYYRYTEHALRRFVDNACMKICILESVGGAPEVITDIFSKCILRVPRIGRPSAALAQWIMARSLTSRLGKSLSESTRDLFPLGYFLVAEKN